MVRSVDTLEQWSVPISANTIERPTAAVVMVMDKSGSMDWGAGDGRSRVEVLRESANVMVDLLRADTGIGIVRFDHDAAPVLNVVDAGAEIFGSGGRRPPRPSPPTSPTRRARRPSATACLPGDCSSTPPPPATTPRP
ncbi:hypothetical protein G7085_13860 [Tessaracoccus sp. HDW20]|uniref:hypothetical protein n=1 Tax=Tessaracoccus coleopterorum TaxID=2714950 RepID=UPI0018D3840E|nr:hypothetical protein [Tessaracoccus coleopterorum]NHB85334.1 hypothetical protein [Tessaracoccus coleopterorum]